MKFIEKAFLLTLELDLFSRTPLDKKSTSKARKQCSMCEGYDIMLTRLIKCPKAMLKIMHYGTSYIVL